MTTQTTDFVWLTNSRLARHKHWSLINIKEAFCAAGSFSVTTEDGSHFTEVYVADTTCVEDSMRTFQTRKALVAARIHPVQQFNNDKLLMAADFNQLKTQFGKEA